MRSLKGHRYFKLVEFVGSFFFLHFPLTSNTGYHYCVNVGPLCFFTKCKPIEDRRALNCENRRKKIYILDNTYFDHIYKE